MSDQEFPLEISPANIQAPSALQQLPGWLVWKFEPDPRRPEKPRKVPYYPVSGVRRHGQQGSQDDLEGLSSFDIAHKAWLSGSYSGIGFALLPEFGIVGLDFDDCVVDQVVDPAVLNLVWTTYSEYSPSGRGVRAFMLGEMPNRKSHSTPERWGFETFHSSGFLTITGNTLEVCRTGQRENTVAALTPEIKALFNERFGNQSATDKAPVDAQPVYLDDSTALDPIPDETMAEVREAAMNGLSQAQVDEYDEWIRVGHAIKSLVRLGRGKEAHELWHECSARSSKYDPEEAEAKWVTFSPRKITFRTIFSMARNAGWVRPKPGKATSGSPTGQEDYSKLEDRTDTGNANLLVRLTDGDLRYIPERQQWIAWDGLRWVGDDYGAVANSSAQRVAQYYLGHAKSLKEKAADPALSKEERSRLEGAAESVERWACRCRNKWGLDSMLSLAGKNPKVMVSVADLDKDPWLLGVSNGVVDLRTGKLRAAARDELVTKFSPATFSHAAKAPRWTKFVEEITGSPLPVEYDPESGFVIQETIGSYRPRPALAAYIQRALGYCMTGCTTEQKMFFAVGDGSNGKNILLDIVHEVGGNYSKPIPPEALMAMRSDVDAERPSPTAATLAGARLAVSSESKEGAKLDVALVKRHTGGGYMTARQMRENTFTFLITHKLWLMTNHKPGLDHLDDALRGRLHLIPFDRVWNRPGHPARNEELPDGDKNLMAHLRGEADGILSWLVEGAVRYYQDGLTPPPEIKKMTCGYFAEQDPMAKWIEGLTMCDPRQGTMASALYGRFLQDQAGASLGMTEKAFCSALGTRYGIRKCKKSSGMYYGISLDGPANPENMQDAG